MKSLTSQDIEILKQDLKEMGLNLHVLKDEILDHFCCLVEMEMENGKSFTESRLIVLKSFDEKEVNNTQKSTRRIHRFQSLKKKMKAISSVAAVLMLLMVAGADAQNKPEGFPIKGETKVTSSYGKRKDPFQKKMRFHNGIDLKAKEGTPVVATGDGKVIAVEENPKGYGKRIVILHGEGYQTRYCHLSAFKVEEGDVVKKGEVIGLVGNTGLSTAPHLHYEILKDGENVDPALLMTK